MRLKNRLLTGIVGGIIGPVIGVLLYYVYLHYLAESIAKGTGLPDVTLAEFFQESWVSKTLNMVFSIGTIFNLVMFFILLWTKWWRSAYGVIYATMGWLVLLGAMTFLL